MVTQTPCGPSRQASVPYVEAVERIKDALKEEGFGILAEIDVKETLREKLNADLRRYDIVCACDPPLAHQALQSGMSQRR